MSPDGLDPEEIRFPVECFFKIIAEDLPGVRAALEKTLRRLEITSELVEGAHSSAGRYVTYELRWVVASLESMREIDRELKAVRGVKMVL